MEAKSSPEEPQEAGCPPCVLGDSRSVCAVWGSSGHGQVRTGVSGTLSDLAAQISSSASECLQRFEET